MKLNDIRISAPDGISYKLNDLLSVKNVTELFNVTNITVYNWLGKADEYGAFVNGKFKHAFKLGGKIYIPSTDIQNVITNKHTNLE